MELMRITEVLSGEFRIGGDMDGFRIKKKVMRTTAKKKDD
tara:strand:- start:280 stop:399 length:120 start_codon:yes stop_codon:yes gene_type:complete